MANDSKNLVIPYGSFKALATLPGVDPEKPVSYTIDFGAFENGSLIIGGDMKENMAPLAGVIGLDKKQRVRHSLSYQFDAKYLSPVMLAYVFGAASGSAPVPGKVVDLYGIMQMSAQDEIAQADGSAIYAHHSFKAAVWFEGPLTMNGADFMMAKLNVDVYLGSFPGLYTAAARPVTQA